MVNSVSVRVTNISSESAETSVTHADYFGRPRLITGPTKFKMEFEVDEVLSDAQKRFYEIMRQAMGSGGGTLWLSDRPPVSSVPAPVPFVSMKVPTIPSKEGLTDLWLQTNKPKVTEKGKKDEVNYPNAW